MSTCGWLRDREAEALTLRAFKQACDEAGIAGHPDGKCPFPDCNCRDFADRVEARAIQIIEAQIGPLPPDRCICGPDSTGESPDCRPDCPVHGANAPYDAAASDTGEVPF